ncbi:Signal-induced proliferation-associated 1-like protein 2 [Anopheles sinensis]|uniref:Signal-induced proliferation-associated 1-like protein 2 n=1 Tax=Anopheles sinensis TaxID=74873 RepID=A0A084VU12_ANOSI|nr:Signal-induced proliferation-associated 1-like protein 2 [Anopheles sinensis]
MAKLPPGECIDILPQAEASLSQRFPVALSSLRGAKRTTVDMVNRKYAFPAFFKQTPGRRLSLVDKKATD